MNLHEFLNQAQFSKQKEIEKVLLIGYFNLKALEENDFDVKSVSETLVKLGYAKPNLGRLEKNIKKSKLFLLGGKKDKYRIHPITIETLDTQYPDLVKKTEEVFSRNSVIDESLMTVERTFVTNLIRQINASYENNIFDGCAVLMRRLLEVLLILAFDEQGETSKIKDDNNNYKQLNRIIDLAGVNSKLALSRNTKESLEPFRKLGNFSAHKIYYNAKRNYIEKMILDYQAVIEELMYKASLRK